MYKNCAYQQCDGVFSTIGARGNKKYCKEDCYKKASAANNKIWHAKENKKNKKKKDVIKEKPVKVVHDRCIIKLSTPKNLICGGCGKEWVKEYAHEQYCYICEDALIKRGNGGYQLGNDDNWLHPQTGV